MGDCFFLAAVSSMAERPELLKPLFKQKEVTSNMFYTINLYIEGVQTPVTIDKYLPTYQGQLLFAQGINKRELWVPFLEKAYAKLSGTFM